MEISSLKDVKKHLRVPGARVLVRRNLPPKETAGGLVIPDVAQNPWRQRVAEVVALGQGYRLREDGCWDPFDFKVGDKVVVPVYEGTLVRVGDVDDLQVLLADQVEAVVVE